MDQNEDTFAFDDFVVDVPARELRRGAERIPLTARYFDALALLLRERGRLIGKERFFDEVWGDVVVSDGALTQCIKDIRKALGDSPSEPRFIETVPRHGYRFIAVVEPRAHAASLARARRALLETLSGTAGGGMAGLVGGVLYGLALAQSQGPGALGTASIVLVMMALAAFIGILGGVGVSLGLAAARLAVPASRAWQVAGAALGGMLVGTTAKLLGLDAFNLLLGRTPAGITGGLEGAALGAAIGVGLLLGAGAAGGSARGVAARVAATRRWQPVLGAALAAGAAGVIIPLAGGRLLGGSLQLVAESFATSRLELDALGRFFGELDFGLATQVVLGGVEGLLFGAGLASALVWYRSRP